MYKLPCPNNVLYLEPVGKQPPLRTQTKLVSLRPASEKCYIRTASISQLLFDLLPVRLLIFESHKEKKKKRNLKSAPVPAKLFSELYKT